MARLDDFQGDQRKRITDQYETFLHSLALLRGDRLSADQTSRIVGEAVAGASPDELRSSVPPASAIGRLQQLLAQTVESGRPRNMYGADAARAAQASGGADGQRGAGFGYIDAAIRANSSARFREMVGDSVKGTGTSGASGVTADYARSFAGSGIVGGTLRTFAEIGLQRSVYDAYREEGFSRADIADAATTAKTLRWKNDREAFDDLQRSTKAQRAAIVAIDAEDDPAKRQTLIDQKAKGLGIDKLPPDAQARWRRNIDRVQGKGHGVEHGQEVGKGAKQHDAAIAADHAGPKQSADKASQDQQGKKFTKTTVASLAGAADDLLDGPVKTPAKPAPSKVAAAKPAAPGSAPT